MDDPAGATGNGPGQGPGKVPDTAPGATLGTHSDPPLVNAPGPNPGSNPGAATPAIDSGVSNGDVDWLFRGKSKKLTKKMNNINADKERRCSTSAQNEGKERPGSAADSNVGKKSEREPFIKEENEQCSDHKHHDTAKHGSSPPLSAPKGEGLPPDKQAASAGNGKSKLGRIRSSSTSLLGTLNPEAVAPRRRGSTSSAVSTNLVSSTTSPQDADEKSGQKGSSGGKTRSLFSSFSSKFKSSNSGSTSPKSGPGPGPALSSFSLTGNMSSLPGAKNTGHTSLPSAHEVLSTLSRDDNRSRRGLGPWGESPSSSVEKDKGRFFRRRLSQSSLADRDALQELTKPRVVLNKDPNRKRAPLAELLQLGMKRVNFAVDRLGNDPQQQIPSRRPRMGNVIIPEELTAPPPKLSQGISSNDGNKSASKTTYTERELQAAKESRKRALALSEMHAQEAHAAAKRVVEELANFKFRTETAVENDEEEFAMTKNAESVAIDSPLHVHEKHFDEEPDSEQDNDEELTLETVYTRCCHLREILPIPATLRQLKNKSRPLQVLKMLNPKPTLIDVLSFSDFIAITPINTVIFDNVTMSTDMLRHFLSALVNSRALEKLSLRNVAIDNAGWKLLCDFLSRNLTVKKLDISQQKVKPDTASSAIRANMNWALFTKAVVVRGGLEELVLNGCKLTDQVFTKLMKEAISISTRRLGLASVELNVFKAQVVSDWIAQPDSLCMGVDMGFNDLSHGQLEPFIAAFNKGNDSLRYFSLNSTKLTSVDQVSQMLQSLVHLRSLRFLDLSSLPDVFPGLIPRLNTYLPQFPSLKRIHFDFNELSAQAISAIAEILARVDGLVHVSFLGNRNLAGEAMASLYSAVKVSKTLFTLDIDYDLVSEDFSQRLAFYLTRNMSRAMDVEYHIPAEDQEELMFDGSLLMETAERLLVENEKGTEKKEDAKLKKIVADALVERTEALRKDIHMTIDRLFERRNNNQLSFEGKETLIRFCLLDASLEKLVKLFEEQSSKYGMSPSPSVVVTEETSKAALFQNLHDTLHESSSELITAGPILSPRNVVGETSGGYFGGEQSLQPHQVVLDASSDGKTVPIDNLTGRPVLMRSISQTSLHAKEQEQEEGEFHRFGYFMQKRNHEKKDKPTFKTLPSGSQLRDAVLTAKGIESVTDLIENINSQQVSIEKIYEDKRSLEKTVDESEHDDIASIDSETSQGTQVNAVVDEVYDRLLNDAQRVRSNKQE